MMVFSYMTPLVWKAAHTPHLRIEQLPRIVDGDEMKNLVRRHFEVSAPNVILWAMTLSFIRAVP